MSSVEMPRKYAVLQQFTLDLNRLLTEAESAFSVLRVQKTPTQAQILGVYRPIHSLKGICGMVEETKLLVRAFHALEDVLPPLLAVTSSEKAENKPEKKNWIKVAQGTFEMAREVERLLVAKLELWRKLGADDHEILGLVISFREDGVLERTWVGITALEGLVDSSEVPSDGSGYVGVVGTKSRARRAPHEVLLIESSAGPVAVYFEEIETTCTRQEAAEDGVPTAFKEWWANRRKHRAA